MDLLAEDSYDLAQFTDSGSRPCLNLTSARHSVDNQIRVGPLYRRLAQASKPSTNKLLGERYKKFRQMGETSAYSQEAMDREVDLLLQISASSRRAKATVSGQRKRASNKVPEAPVVPMEVD